MRTKSAGGAGADRGGPGPGLDGAASQRIPHLRPPLCVFGETAASVASEVELSPSGIELVASVSLKRRGGVQKRPRRCTRKQGVRGFEAGSVDNTGEYGVRTSGVAVVDSPIASVPRLTVQMLGYCNCKFR